MQDLIGSVANNVDALMLSFAPELEQLAGWRSATPSDGISFIGNDVYVYACICMNTKSVII